MKSSSYAELLDQGRAYLNGDDEISLPNYINKILHSDFVLLSVSGRSNLARQFTVYFYMKLKLPL